MTTDPVQRSAVSPGVFKAAMAALAAPVTVVSFYGPGGEARGLTASAVCSLSLDPPLLLVCLDRRTAIHNAVVAADAFCVNILGAEGRPLALRFASRSDQHFAGVPLLPGRSPALAEAAVRLQCEKYGLRDGGDHTILLGRVADVDGDALGGLLWHQRGFAYARGAASID